MASCVSISIKTTRAQSTLKKLESLLKQRNRKLQMHLRKFSETKRARNVKQAQMICNLDSEIKDLLAQKSQAYTTLTTILNNELEKVDNQTKRRKDYLSRNNIRPSTAFEYIQSENMSKDSLRTTNDLYSSKNKDFKAKSGIDSQSAVLLNNSKKEYPKSVMSCLKSPSQLDSLSIFESSPILKRMKLSESDEKEYSGDNFNLSESCSKASSQPQLLRKSKRKKRKSKILREAIGEDEEIPPKPVKRAKRTKVDQEISRIIALDKAAKKQEEIISRNNMNNYLGEMEDNHNNDDSEYFCFCQTISFGNMVACDRKECPIEWFHFDCVGLTTMPEGNWYCQMCKEKVDE
uniref:PHD-type domain-containing protein n=1 Tax=Euplotes vannus TaxID=5939 RepID=Q6A1N3_EUPVA|nr:hypothetical protein [Euplotes vannus]